jgi:hypothetical protein
VLRSVIAAVKQGNPAAIASPETIRPKRFSVMGVSVANFFGVLSTLCFFAGCALPLLPCQILKTMQ